MTRKEKIKKKGERYDGLLLLPMPLTQNLLEKKAVSSSKSAIWNETKNDKMGQEEMLNRPNDNINLHGIIIPNISWKWFECNRNVTKFNFKPFLIINNQFMTDKKLKSSPRNI